MSQGLIVDLETTTPGPKPRMCECGIEVYNPLQNWNHAERHARWEQQFAWAAGFLVADGTMGIYNTGRPTGRGPGWAMKVRASNADSAPLLQLQRIFGGTLCPLTLRPLQTTQHFEWGTQGTAALKVLSRVFPFLTGRHRWLAALLTLFPYYSRGSKGYGYTEAEHKRRKEVVAWTRQAIKTHL